MKIVNEKGKLFGIINLVDLLVILLVIAIVGVVGIKLFGSKAAEAVSTKVDCYAEVEVIGAYPRLFNEVERQMDELMGARMIAGNDYINATIEDVWYEDCISNAADSDGNIVYSVDDTRCDIVFLIKTQVSEDSAILSVGSQELRSGRSLIIKTQALETSGVIRYVNIGEYDGEGRANEISLDRFRAEE